MEATRILMGILIGMGGLSLIVLLIQLFKIKIWVFERNISNHKLLKIGFMNLAGEDDVPEVHLTDKAKGPAIGRIKLGEKDDNAYVELLLTDPDDDAEKPRYHTYGYVARDGYIYASTGKNKRPQKIGYTARPSRPNEPIAVGERTWRSLWLTSTLNAYFGLPEITPEEPTASPEPEKKEPEETTVPEPAPVPKPEPIPVLEPEPVPVLEPEPAPVLEPDPGITSTEEPSVEESAEQPSEIPVQEESVEEVVEEPDQVESIEETPESPTPPINQFKKLDKKAPKKEAKKFIKKPDAVARYTGIHSSSKDPFPPEARAAAFGLFYSKYNKNDHQEHYASPGYGWKDTALLAGFIYAVLYVIWYIFNVKLLGLRFIGYKFWQDIPLYFAFYAIWVIVRAIKIECIERSDTIQPKIDLFNKVVGQKGFDIVILICCAFTLAFSGKYYRFDFLPLACVLITAICINLSLRSSNKPWRMENPFETDEEDDEEELENPRGDIERIYEWDLDSPDRSGVKGDLALYFDAKYISDLRVMNPFFSQRKDKSTGVLVKEMFQYLKSHKSVSARSRYIVKRIEEISRQKDLNDVDTLQFTLDFVQEPNIRFVMNRDSDSIQKFEDYIRYPDEVLYDKEADSNSKAFLAAVLVHYLKYNVLFMYSRLQQHGAIGIEIPKSWTSNLTSKFFGRSIDEISFTHNNKHYLFCETTADGFRIGGTMGGMRPDHFDERVELRVIDVDSDEDNEDSESRLYTWDLDSEGGHQLKGNYTLEFNEDDIEDLRERNPFINYGKDGKTYEENVKWMFDFLDSEPQRKKNVKEIATYIRSTVKNAGLNDLDLLQFTLDFCQAPNITYKIDEECDTIPYNDVSKEYMRFPDEVLYDKEGDCDCKSSLTIALFRELGFKTIFMMSVKYGHAAVGVEYNPEWKDLINFSDENAVVREINGVKYLYCETTGDGYRVGHIKEGDTIQDFETVVEL